MRARAVIGANFGDEGKGLITDYLCAQGAGMVIRFNGGAQAGHTVVTPDGLRHVFSHFGSGGLLGVPTFLSQFFVCNPLLFLTEYKDLMNKGVQPVIYAHPSCIVTTFADMMINQRLEDRRGKGRHGSCGVGVNETINRSDVPELKITMADIWNGANIQDKLKTICTKYTEFRLGEPLKDADVLIDAFVKRCRVFADLIHPLGIGQCNDPVFEGAQGLMLDQNLPKPWFPHLTRSNTGMKNVRILCEQAGIKDIEVYYVSRTYLTRHGAGPLPEEDAKMCYADDTNLNHPYQETLRFAPLDEKALFQRCEADFGGTAFNLVMTHCDQLEPRAKAADLYFSGPTRNDIGHPVVRAARVS